MASEVDKETGLTPEENDVSLALAAAVNTYGSLPEQHPSELDDFVDAIHLCQRLLAIRIARRAFPEGWPTYDREEG